MACYPCLHCNKCGMYPPPVDYSKCPMCGAVLEEVVTNCPECGEPIPLPPGRTSADKRSSESL